MQEHGLSLTCIFPYKDRIKDCDLIRESASKRKPAFWHVLHSVRKQFNAFTNRRREITK